MNADKIFDTYIKFNIGYFFTKKIKLTDATILINEKLPNDYYLNYATLIKAKESEQLISRVEKFFIGKSQTPYFYILPTTTPKNLAYSLAKHGYKVIYSDVWMRFGRAELKGTTQDKFSIRKTKKEECQRIKEIFNEVFTKGESDDPYHGLSQLYGKFFIDRLLDNKKDFKAEGYAAFIGNEMVGVCSLLHDGKISLIEGLAVLPKFRNMGIGEALVLSCVKESRKAGIKNVILSTENGSKNEKVFEKAGFVKEVISQVYGKAA